MTEVTEEPTGTEEPPGYETGGLRLAILVGLVAYVGLAHGWSWVIVIFGIVVMIFLHELGHFLTARLTGMKATEFFIGFGPKIWSFTRGETEYGLKVIPAGAYVRIIGMNNLDEVPQEDEERTYRHQSFPRRLLVVSAGSLMHLLQAFVVAVVLLVVVGVPGGTLVSEERAEKSWIVNEVLPESAAEQAGLQPGDRIVGWDDETITHWEDVESAVGAADVGDRVTLTVLRDGERFDVTTELVDRKETTGEDVAAGTPFLGVGPTTRNETVGLIDGVARATEETGQALWMTTKAVGQFFSPSSLTDFFESAFNGGDSSDGDATATTGDEGESSGNDERMISIFGAVRIGNNLAGEDLSLLLRLFFAINITIGLINMAPLLPLDGGHAAVAIYERLRSRKGQRYYVDVAKLMPMVYAVVMVLLFIGVTALWLDIVDPIQL